MATIAEPEVLEAARTLKNADGSPRIPPKELQPFDEKELEELKERFRARGGGELPEGWIDFSRTTVFDGFWFAQIVDFSRCDFTGGAFFRSATFYGAARFNGATFSEEARFQEATFFGNALFDHATFSGQAWFEEAAFSGSAWFDHATFSQAAWFNLATFKKILYFGDAQFKTYPPDFNGASTLYEGTIWPDAEGWPPAPAADGIARYHRSCYERLKKKTPRHTRSTGRSSSSLQRNSNASR